MLGVGGEGRVPRISVGPTFFVSPPAGFGLHLYRIYNPELPIPKVSGLTVDIEFL